jgi:hypothetical protein
MAVNLRLRPEAAAALRGESERTGVSQQEILRHAVDEHLGLAHNAKPPWPDWVDPPAEPYREPTVRLTLPGGVTTMDILEDLRAERL